MNNYETAFPADKNRHTESGMYLRDYFAAKAMETILFDYSGDVIDFEHCGELSYKMADAMLKARESKK